MAKSMDAKRVGTPVRLENVDYLGVLDDVVWRHPWDDALTRSALDRLLLVQILFGGVGLINDGYLAANPVVLEALASPDSLLVRALEAGLVRILSTASRPSESIARRAEGGVRGHGDLIASGSWPSTSAILDAAAASPGDTRTANWPSRDLTPGFQAIVDRLLASLSAGQTLSSAPREQVQRFLSNFTGALSATPYAPRTQWEKMLVDDVEAGLVDVNFQRAMMELANSIYHLNFGMNLALDQETPVNITTWFNEDTHLLLDISHRPVRPMPLTMRAPQIALAAIPSLVTSLATDVKLAGAKSRFLADPGNSAAQKRYLKLLGPFTSPKDSLVISAPKYVHLDTSGNEVLLIDWHPQGGDENRTISPPGVVKIVMTKEFSKLIVGEGKAYST